MEGMTQAMRRANVVGSEFPSSGRKRRKKSWEEMTEEERSKLTKKERRAAKNRTSAMNSRGRKRKVIEDLRERASKAAYYEAETRRKQKEIDRLKSELRALRRRVGVKEIEKEEDTSAFTVLPPSAPCLRNRCSADELSPFLCTNKTTTNDENDVSAMWSIDKGIECDGGIFEILQRSRTIPVAVMVSDCC